MKKIFFVALLFGFVNTSQAATLIMMTDTYPSKEHFRGKITTAGVYPEAFSVSIDNSRFCQIEYSVLKELNIDPANLAYTLKNSPDAEITCEGNLPKKSQISIRH